MYKSTGIIRYNEGHRLTVEVDQGIADFYRSLIPKWIKTQSQMYAAHITVVRTKKETPLCLDAWGKYEGELIDFYYNPEIRIEESYCWLDVYCKQLETIRKELGLPVESLYTIPPEGFDKVFHMTIANRKFLF